MARSRSRRSLASVVLAVVAPAFVLGCRAEDAPPQELTLPPLEPLPPVPSDPDAASCGFDVLDDRPPAIDPCTGGEVLLGPETVTRDTGAPEDLSWPFSIAADGVLCLIVENDGLSSARFLLDEETVIGPERFNPRVERIEKQAAASAGAHVLWARVASGPRRSLTWTLRFAAGASPESVEFAGDHGLLTLRALRDAPDPFSPNGDARFDATELAVTARVARYPGSRHFQYAVASVFEVYSGESCGRVRSLTAVAEADPRSDAAYTTAASWDGMDEAGAVVPDGVYYYRAVTRFVRVNSGGVVEVFDEATTAFRPVRVDTQPPSLTLDPDVEGLITAETPLVVTGYVHDEVDVRVLVNGNEAALVDYRFSGEASLAEGPNAVVVEAIDAAGNSESLVRQVTLDTQPPVLGPATLEGLPAAGAEVGTLSPRLVVSYEDSPAGVFGGGVSLRVNGSEQRRDSAITDVGIDLVLANVRAGTNSLVLVVPDRAGNESRLEVSFVVRAGWEVRVTDPGSPIFGAALVVPAGALPAGEDPVFTLDRFGAGVPALAPGQPAGAGMVLAGALVEAGPSGTVFEAGTPAELTLPYDPGALGNPGGGGYVPEEFVRVARLVNPDDAAAGAPPEFEAVAGPYRIDPARNTVTVRVEHLTPFAATTRAIPPLARVDRAFLASRGLAADADETIEVIDLETMRPTGQRFNPRHRVFDPVWPGGRCGVRMLRMSPDDATLWAVLGCRLIWGMGESDFYYYSDHLAALDPATLRLQRAFWVGPVSLLDSAFIRDFAFSANGEKVFALVDTSAGAVSGHGSDGIYQFATTDASGTRANSPVIGLPVGTSASLLVGRATIDPDGPDGSLPAVERDVAAVATIEGQQRLTEFEPAPEPAFWGVASAEAYRAALTTWWTWPYGGELFWMNSWTGIAYGTFQSFSTATGEPMLSGYGTYRELLGAGGCAVIELGEDGAISNWGTVQRYSPTGLRNSLSECSAVPETISHGWVMAKGPWRLSDGHLFGGLIVNGQIGFVDLTGGRVLDTIALQDRFSAIHGGQPSSFTEAHGTTVRQLLAVANDFSVDLAVAPDGSLIVKGLVVAMDQVGEPRPGYPHEAFVGSADGYAAAVSSVGSFADLAAEVSSAAGTPPVTTTLLDWTETGSFHEDLLAKSNLSITPAGEAVTVNDRGEVIFVDLATGDRVAGLILARPGPGPNHYLSASLDQGMLVEGAAGRSVTVVAFSDAPEATVGYHPASTAVHVIDNSTHALLPGSMDGASAGISFNADRGRHALVGFHQLPGSRIDARYGLRPPWLGYAVRHDDLVDFVAIVPPQDLDGDGNPDDDGNGIPDVGLAALEEGLGVVGSGGSATLRIFLHDSMRLDPDTADPEDCRPILPGEEFRETAAGSGVWFLSPRPHPGSEIHLFLDPTRTNLIVEFVAYDDDGNPIDRDGDTAADAVLCPDPNCPVWADPARLTLDPGGAIRIPDFPIGGTGCDGEREVFADIVTEFPTPSGAQQSAVSDALRFVVDHTGPSAEVEDATFVPTAGPVVVRFDEEVVAEPAWTRIVVREAGPTSRVPGSLHERLLLPDRPGDPSRTALDFVPDTPLADWRNYEVVIPPDVTDLAGNPVAGSPDLVVPFRTRSALAEEMLRFFPSVGVSAVHHVQRDLESSASWILGREYFHQFVATRAITQACLSPPVRALGGIGLDEAAATAVLAAVLYSPDGYFHDETMGGGRADQIVDRAALRIDRAAAVPAIRWTCEPDCDEGDPLPHRVPEFLTFVGFHAEQLRSNIEAAVAPARDPAATPAAASAARRTAWEAVWSYVPNAFLTRYEALRDRGHIRVPAEQLQAALTEYLWWAGARHSPPDVMTGSCAGLAHGGAADRLECALRYLRSALSDQAAILAGAITSVLLSDSSGEDPRLTGWSLGEVDEVLAALADGRDLVDVATRSLLLRLGEIHAAGDTPEPSIVAHMPSSAASAGGPVRVDFTTYAARMPADPGFESSTTVESALRTFGSAGDACGTGDLPWGAASIVAAEEWFQAYRFSDTIGGLPRHVADLRTWGIGAGAGYPSVPDDHALALLLMARDAESGTTSESYVEIAFPPGAERLEFKYLYWAENRRPRLAPEMTAASAAVVGGTLDDLTREPVETGRQALTFATETVVPAADYGTPCCPQDRMNDAIWGTPCPDARNPASCAMCRRSAGGPLCSQFDSSPFGACPATDWQRYTLSCEADYESYCVDRMIGAWGMWALGAMEVLATTDVADLEHPDMHERYRFVSLSREDLGIPPADPDGWVRIALSNVTPSNHLDCPLDIAEDRRVCDSLEDRLQIDDLHVKDCAGNTLSPSSTEAVDCGATLEARVGEIGVVNLDDAPTPGVPVEVSTGFATEPAFALRAGGADGRFGWRLDATITPDPGIAPDLIVADVTCRIFLGDGGTVEFPVARRDGLSFLCAPDSAVLAGIPVGELLRAGGTVAVNVRSIHLSVRVPSVHLVADERPPSVPSDGRFDTFPPCHGTFLEGETVLVWADVADDAVLSKYGCTTSGEAAVFADTSFPSAHRIPEGRRQEVAFEWEAPDISPATRPFMDYPLTCSTTDAVGRRGEGFTRAGRIVRVPQFGIQPFDREYDDPDRHIVLVPPGERLSFEPTPPAPELPAGSGLELRYQFAIDAGTGAWDDPAGSEFVFEEPGAYYIQGVVGRTMPSCGTFDNVRLSQNVVVVVVEPYEAQIVTPDFLHLRGIAAHGAPYPQPLVVQLTDSAGRSVEREGVPLNVAITEDVLTFTTGALATSTVLYTNARGRAWAPLYSNGFWGNPDVVVSRPASGAAPDVELDRISLQLRAVIVTEPHGVPTASSDTEIGTSQICFDDALPGTLTIRAEAQWEDGMAFPDPAGLCSVDPAAVACHLFWEVDDVGDSPLTWTVADPVEPRRGFGPSPNGVIRGLPMSFESFGPKRVVLSYAPEPGFAGGIPVDDQWIEVFFDVSATNHGGPHANATAAHTLGLPSNNCPNGFYYGVEIAGLIVEPLGLPLYDSNMPVSASGTGVDGLGEVKAISEWWSYREAPEIILVGPAALDTKVIDGTRLEGVRLLLSVVEHEDVHVRQVERFNLGRFYDGRTGRITSLAAPCVHTPPAPGIACGWAFCNSGACVRDSDPLWNRFEDRNGSGLYEVSADLNLDADQNCIPDTDPDNYGLDPGMDDIEEPAYAVQPKWATTPDRIPDWGCPGLNWGGTGLCVPVP